ncbi:diacylglycerol lipase-beta-like isoform X3 [Dysidea avara]|uniref:diacylglycerol lipase-beta-like isoform X3 n=1 Tax=Dysidea avara TaxID=196820 RepID=UPI003324C300
MPRMVCCNKTWSVGSDDFVISSILGVIFRLFWIGGLIAFTIVVLVGGDCFPEDSAKQIVYTFICSQIFIQICVVVSEALIGFVSSRGTINDAHPRRHLPHLLRLRAFLYFAEVLGCAFGSYVAWSSYIKNHIDCAREDRVRQAIQAYVINVIVILTIFTLLFLTYYDPLGLQTPSLLMELYIKYSEDETDGSIDVKVKKVGKRGEQKEGNDMTTTKLYSASSKKQWTRRVKAWCCCVGAHNNTSRVKALEDIAHAMATMFDGVDIVLSDFMTGLMLIHHDQRQKMKSKQIDLAARLRNITYQLMDDNGDNFFTSDYEKHPTEKEVDFSLPETHLMMKDIKHYLKFALGIYGWPLYLFINPLVGPVCLCAHLKYRALNRHARDFVQDNCCLANTTALELCSHLENKDVIFVSYENKVCMPPFSLCFDHPNKAVVLSIRGSMSLKDALTDMHISMQDITVDDDKYKNLVTKVHCGMYGAAKNVMKQVNNRLEMVFAYDKYHDYKLIISGHSLGAGVAAVLAVLYHSRYENLHCYAFSPPGSVFTLPLVEYSKSFITTIIYGNDIIPRCVAYMFCLQNDISHSRLTFRGLLYLKKNITHLFMHCKFPKHAILCPSMFSCCYGKYQDHHHQQEFNCDLYDHSVEEGLLKTPISSNNDELAEKVHRFVEEMYTIEQAPAFVPGRVLYIRETGKRIHKS